VGIFSVRAQRDATSGMSRLDAIIDRVQILSAEGLLFRPWALDERDSARIQAMDGGGAKPSDRPVESTSGFLENSHFGTHPLGGSRRGRILRFCASN
jgi:hypothetical protein